MSLRSSAICLSFLLAGSCQDVRDLSALGAALKREYPDSAPADRLPFRLARTVVSAGLTQADSIRAVESCKAWRELQ